ncbi:MAG: hypothetical protein HRU43_05480 [Simkaniaceae bacterium]|nr:hypothetical protein [Simkaniaceae bacterium]
MDTYPIPDSNIPGFTPKACASHTHSQDFGDVAEAFYTWYQSIRQQGFPEDGFHGLQILMKISRQGTATKQESAHALQRLSHLMESIEDGSVHRFQIPHEINQIVDTLTSHNPKSRLIMQVIQIQIAANLAVFKMPQELRTAMDLVLDRVSTNTPNIKAEEISRSLKGAVDIPKSAKALHTKILEILD